MGMVYPAFGIVYGKTFFAHVSVCKVLNRLCSQGYHRLLEIQPP